MYSFYFDIQQHTILLSACLLRFHLVFSAMDSITKLSRKGIKKSTTKFTSAKLKQNMFCLRYTILTIHRVASSGSTLFSNSTVSFLTQLFFYQKADDKIFVCKFSKMLSSSYIILSIQRLRANSVDLDEPPRQDLRCLQNQLFWSLVLKELNSD